MLQRRWQSFLNIFRKPKVNEKVENPAAQPNLLGEAEEAYGGPEVIKAVQAYQKAEAEFFENAKSEPGFMKNIGSSPFSFEEAMENPSYVQSSKRIAVERRNVNRLSTLVEAAVWSEKGMESPEMAEARVNFLIALQKYEAVLAKEPELKLIAQNNGVSIISYFFSRRERKEAAQKELDVPGSAYDAAFLLERKRHDAMGKAAEAQRIAEEEGQAIHEVSIVAARVLELEAELLKTEQQKVTLEGMPKEKRNPKVKLEYAKVTLKIVELNYKLLAAKAEASQAVLFADVVQESKKRMAYKTEGRTNTEIEGLITQGRQGLQTEYIADQEKLKKATGEYESAREKVSQDVQKAEVFLKKEVERIHAKRAAQNEVSPPSLAPEIRPAPVIKKLADVEQNPDVVPEEEVERKPAKGP